MTRGEHPQKACTVTEEEYSQEADTATDEEHLQETNTADGQHPQEASSLTKGEYPQEASTAAGEHPQEAITDPGEHLQEAGAAAGEHPQEASSLTEGEPQERCDAEYLAEFQVDYDNDSDAEIRPVSRRGQRQVLSESESEDETEPLSNVRKREQVKLRAKLAKLHKDTKRKYHARMTRQGTKRLSTNSQAKQERKRDQSNWKWEQSKQARNAGEAHTSVTEGKHVEGRQMGAGCAVTCRYRWKQKISEEQRAMIFSDTMLLKI